MLIILPRSKFAAGAQGYSCGSEHSECVVLIHGVGLALEAWQPQLHTLAQHYRVLVLDLPGHGRSEPLASGANLSDYVHWLATVLKGLGEQPVSLVGHSLGALIALGTAIEYPELVKRVALLNGVYRRDQAASAAVMARARQISAGDCDPSAPLNRWFDKSEHQGSAYRLTSSLLHQANPSGYAAAYQAFASGDSTYSDRLGEIESSLLALTGDGDSNSTAQMAQAMAAGARKGRAVVLEGHRHMLNLTAPTEVNAALLHWLEDWK